MAESPTPDHVPAEEVTWFAPQRPVGGTVHVRPPARDRAAEVIAEAIEESLSEFVHQRIDERGGGWEADPSECARVAVDTLLADREVLSALAGVPSPGVEAPRIWWSPSSPRPFLVEHDPRSDLPSPERRFRHLAPCDDYSALPHDAVPVHPAAQRELVDEFRALAGDMAGGLAVGGNDDHNLRDYLVRLRQLVALLGHTPGGDIAALRVERDAARAEVERLRAQRAAVLTLADTAEHGATRWEQPLPVPEWVGRVREALGVALLGHTTTDA